MDTLNASSGQGLLTIVAAEAAAEGMGSDEIESLLTELVPLTQTIAIPHDLSSAVRGGRVPAWLKRITDFLRVTPVLMAKNGKLGIAGVRAGRGADPGALAGQVVKRMRSEQVYRVLISHVANDEGAHHVRRMILEQHPMIHSCHIAEAGPALGAHLGIGGLIVGFLPQPEVLS